MNKLFFFIIFFGITVLTRMSAQNLSEQIVSFVCDEKSIPAALIQLSNQTGINIAFSDRFFEGCQNVSFHIVQKPLKDVMNALLSGTKVSWRVAGNQILCYRVSARFTLSGYIEDAHTGERLSGASVVVLPAKGVGAISNEFGFFSLTLAEDNYNLSISFIGYQREIKEIRLNQSRTMNIALTPSLLLKELVISDSLASDGKPLPETMSARPISLKNLPILAMPGGETDLIRFLQWQPGVQSGADGLGGLYIRGGNADQNLVLLDDVPVYNSGHALGLLSIFNYNTIKSVKFLKGDFPARYGGRTSSVVDIRTRDGSMKDFRGEVSAGLFSATANLEGPIVRDKCSFLISGRYSYLDPYIRYASRTRNVFLTKDARTRYYFYDINAKLNYILSQNDKFYLSFYKGKDDFKDRYPSQDSLAEGIRFNNSLLDFKWGNTIAALRWNHLFSTRLFSNTTLTYSLFSYFNQFSNTEETVSPGGLLLSKANFGKIYQSQIEDWAGKMDFSYFPAAGHIVRWGGGYIRHRFRPGVLTFQNDLSGSPLPDPADVVDSLSQLLLNSQPSLADESFIYIEDSYTPFKQLEINPGLHVSSFQAGSKTYYSVQPRLSVSYQMGKRWEVHAGLNKMTQYLHQVGTYNASLPFDLWVPATASIRPQDSWQYALGLGGSLPQYFRLNVEGYYKELFGLITYQEGESFLANGGVVDGTLWEKKVTPGKGRSYGVEFQVERTEGKTSGMLSYTLSWAERTFSEVNFGNTYPFRYDRRHDIKLLLIHRFSAVADISATWVYGTGNAITLTGTKYLHLLPGGYTPELVYQFSTINGYRLPAYHRLDLALNVHLIRKKTEHHFQLGVYNAYNRKNPFALYVNSTSGSKGNAKQYSILPVFPALRYEIKFKFQNK